jgi:hypothetical protein
VATPHPSWCFASLFFFHLVTASRCFSVPGADHTVAATGAAV